MCRCNIVVVAEIVDTTSTKYPIELEALLHHDDDVLIDPRVCSRFLITVKPLQGFD
jgi:hypothetical protein